MQYLVKKNHRPTPASDFRGICSLGAHQNDPDQHQSICGGTTDLYLSIKIN